jgi:hypothetical protein
MRAGPWIVGVMCVACSSKPASGIGAALMKQHLAAIGCK